MRVFRLLSVLLFPVLLLSLSGCGSGKPPAPKVAMKLPVLNAAPAWKLQDLNGQTVSMEQLKGKVVIVDFWATWCGPCREEIPAYIEMQNKYGKYGFTVLGLSLDTIGVDVVKKFTEKEKMNYPIIIAGEEVQAAFGGLNVAPTAFLIDRAGNIRVKREGIADRPLFEDQLLNVLAE